MDIAIFTVEEQQFAIELSSVERVVRAVEITPLPNAPAHIKGVINVAGDVIPVINMLTLLGMADREIRLTDQLILCCLQKKRAALWVTKVKKIATFNSDELIPARDVFPELESVDYVVKDDAQIILIYRTEDLLSRADITAVRGQ